MIVLTSYKTVEDALRDCVKIDAKAFGLIVVTEDGQKHLFSSPSLQTQHHRIFPKQFQDEFMKAVRRVDDERPYSSQGKFTLTFQLEQLLITSL